MSVSESILEAEVIEIDGIVAQQEKEPQQSSSWKSTSQWQGQLKRLDLRWWPLWVILGLFALIFAIIIGSCVFVILAFIKLVRGLIRIFTGKS